MFQLVLVDRQSQFTSVLDLVEFPTDRYSWMIASAQMAVDEARVASGEALLIDAPEYQPKTWSFSPPDA